MNHTLLIILVVLGWIACGVFGYLVFRWGLRQLGPWTIGDRYLAIAMSLWGPAFAFAATLTLMARFGKSHFGRPAKW
jgi:NhaP-type Na+/H+ or K+/H+ antiporter